MSIEPDVVLCLGVLYHMKDPFAALRRLAELTGDLAVIETEVIFVTGLEDRSFCEFYAGKELKDDPTNWWAPNARAVEGMCRAAGFRRVECVHKTTLSRLRFLKKLLHYRGVFHAYK